MCSPFKNLPSDHENVIWHSAEGNQSQAQEHVCYHLAMGNPEK